MAAGRVSRGGDGLMLVTPSVPLVTGVFDH